MANIKTESTIKYTLELDEKEIESLIYILDLHVRSAYISNQPFEKHRHRIEHILFVINKENVVKR